MKIVKCFFLCVAMAIVAFGCEVDKQKESKALDPNQVIVSPTSLFNEHTKMLEPHLGKVFGAVNIDYDGPLDWIACGCEIWENGKKKRGGPSFRQPIKTPLSGTLSISIQDIHSYEDESKLDLVICFNEKDKGGASTKSYVLKPTLNITSSFIRPLYDSIIVSARDEIVVWGYMLSNQYESQNKETIVKTAENSEWALLLTFQLGKENP